MFDWPHSPVHRFQEGGTYIVTGSTHLKRPLFRGPQRLQYLSEKLLELAGSYAWQLQAWAVFPNHYHFVGLHPGATKEAASKHLPSRSALAEFIRHLHSLTAIQLNRWEGTPGRRVWFQYWDTRLTFQRSYLARLGYVHRNAVHHGLVQEPSLYPWCSAGWLQRRATAAFYETVMRMKVGRLHVRDDFSVARSDI